MNQAWTHFHEGSSARKRRLVVPIGVAIALWAVQAAGGWKLYEMENVYRELHARNIEGQLVRLQFIQMLQKVWQLLRNSGLIGAVLLTAVLLLLLRRPDDRLDLRKALICFGVVWGVGWAMGQMWVAAMREIMTRMSIASSATTAGQVWGYLPISVLGLCYSTVVVPIVIRLLLDRFVLCGGDWETLDQGQRRSGWKILGILLLVSVAVLLLQTILGTNMLRMMDVWDSADHFRYARQVTAVSYFGQVTNQALKFSAANLIFSNRIT